MAGFRSNVCAAFVVTLALSAAIRTADAQETPGTVADTLRPAPALQRPELPQIDKTQAPAPAPVDGGGRKIVVSQFRIAGNSLYSTEELMPLLSDFVGKPLTLLELYEAADQITGFYVRNGVTLASAIIPTQVLTNGTVLILVSEGRIGQVKVEGNQRYRASTLSKYLTPAAENQIYRSGILESDLLRLNELPGLEARAVLKPGSDFGTSDLVIQAEEDPFEGSVFVDNYGRENIGTYRFGGNAAFNNPLTIGDRLNVMAMTSSQQLLRYGSIEYSVPLGHQGTRLSASYGYADFELDGPFHGIDGKNKTAHLAVTTPWILTRRDRFSTSVGLSDTRANVDLSGLTFQETRITLAEVNANFRHVYPNFALSQVALGLASNGSNGSKADGDAQPLRVELDMQHLQPLWPAASLDLYVRLNGVYSHDPLPDTSQFSVGGPSSVRGYPSAEIRGDRGYQGTLALQKEFGLGRVRVRSRLFADAGYVERIDVPPGTSDSDDISSVGIGADTLFPHDVTLRLDAAYPLQNRQVSDNRDDGRIFGSLTMGF
ncbi:ShlB/FhaC/HecB family hemolysin secretion/activation protein [Sinimarinibacterium sp. CAU 1509]|uniref:ShlB/FhaC/HecB family hemolysin secretion/activation protein n=1 Tax=Sinimarinibacterium sp. CAU 1509 TaxID=2562283 RepID=UPI0010AC2582|nr:ShlB/FhaC/HecB family hemolysin secretion/activation protein [Sinimarinibacterium sp. CAU 1509]TJY61054.1 ShlB/FhaC/HecB family hemolysin secretion/activation protein [Sinimarinibacterium sp. CAU 1509]